MIAPSRTTTVAVEHDGAWAALVNDMPAPRDLNNIARVLHAPLQGDPEWASSDRSAQNSLAHTAA